MISKDFDGHRTLVSVSEVDPAAYAYPSPRKRGPQPISHAEWVRKMIDEAA
jgi:hypothetical protein